MFAHLCWNSQKSQKMKGWFFWVLRSAKPVCFAKIYCCGFYGHEISRVFWSSELFVCFKTFTWTTWTKLIWRIVINNPECSWGHRGHFFITLKIGPILWLTFGWDELFLVKSLFCFRLFTYSFVNWEWESVFSWLTAVYWEGCVTYYEMKCCGK